MVDKDIRLRPMELTDLEALMQIKNEEHWNQTENDWMFLLENYAKYCLVAEIDNHVVGTVTSTNFNHQVGWIGMMLVRKPYRGQGISKKLMRSVIDLLKDDCDSIKLDATPAGEKVYNKLDFRKEYIVYRITNMEEERPSLSRRSTMVQKINPGILQQIKVKDEEIFGADRSDLLDYLLKQHTDCHGYAAKGGEIKGYVFSRFGTNYTQIGPVIAESEKIAQDLVEWSISRLSGPLVIDIPADKTNLIQWVEGHGFKIQREFIRMYLTSNPYPGIIEKCFAIAGPEYG